MNSKILFNSPDFEKPIPELEQYSTPPDIAFEILKKVNSAGNLSGRVADLGCGTGRLAISAAILGANVTGFEIDEDAIEIAKEYSNNNNLEIEWINKAIEGIEDNFDTIIMNPPFGSQRPGADRIFLEKAMEISEHIWTIHLSETRKFIEKLVEKNNCKIIELYEFDYPLKNSMPFHSKDISVENAILYHIASLPN
ncbi:MAG: METTL5 family protein [Candidatus Poseidoniia archaeon]|nr:METTL5 family protein [Candidatus Poseidoniia archaeon]